MSKYKSLTTTTQRPPPPGKDGSLDNETKGTTQLYVETGSEHLPYFMHFIILDQLEARTSYSFKVKSGDSPFSSVYNFTSLYGAGETTKFAIFGDMGVYSWNNMCVPRGDTGFVHSCEFCVF